MDREDFPWQPNGDTDREMVACVNFGGEMHLYASGFEDGAEALYKVLQEQRHGQDLLVYPLVYCLRHAIELALKQVIRGARLLTDDDERGFPHDHNLWRLWSTCSPILKRIWPAEGNESAYFIVENTVRSFRQIDQTGEAFRYPVGRNWGPTLDPELRHLDLDQLYREVEVTLDLLMGADAGIDFYMDGKREMETERRAMHAEMRAEYEQHYESEYERDYDAGGWI